MFSEFDKKDPWQIEFIQAFHAILDDPNAMANAFNACQSLVKNKKQHQFDADELTNALEEIDKYGIAFATYSIAEGYKPTALLKLAGFSDAEIQKIKITDILKYEAALHAAIIKLAIKSDEKNVSETVIIPPLTKTFIQEKMQQDAFIKALLKENDQVIEQLLKEGVPCNFIIEHIGNATPLHIAVFMGNEKIVKLLLKYGADLSMKDIDADTPLHVAVRKNHLNIVHLLIEHKADLNAQNLSGDTPLHHAVKNRNTKLIRLLLDPKQKKYVNLLTHISKQIDLMTSVHKNNLVSILKNELPIDIKLSHFMAEACIQISQSTLNHKDKMILNQLSQMIDIPAIVNHIENEIKRLAGKFTNLGFFERTEININGQIITVSNQLGKIHSFLSDLKNPAIKNKIVILGQLLLYVRSTLPDLKDPAILNVFKSLENNLTVRIDAEKMLYGQSSYNEKNKMNGADPNIENKDGDTPLALAMKAQDTQITVELETNGAKLSPQQQEQIKKGLTKIINADIPKQFSTYEHQIIISVDDHDLNAKRLKEKWDSEHPGNPCIIIQGSDLVNDTIDTSVHGLINNYWKSDSKIRIYVLGHSSPGSDSISDSRSEKERGIEIETDTMADKLKNIIGSHQHVFVNLISCGAGKGQLSSDARYDTGLKSFAAKLHAKLYETLNRNIPVTARLHEVGFSAENVEKHTIPLELSWDEEKNEYALNLHKQPGSKVIYTIHEGEQVKLDAYYFDKWKRDVINLLISIRTNTQQSEKIKLLNTWLDKSSDNSFYKKSSADILKTLKDELKKESSPLKQYTYTFLFASKTNRLDELNKLMIQGERILQSDFTVTHPVKTGRKFPQSPK